MAVSSVSVPFQQYYPTFLRCSILKMWACFVVPQTRWSRVRVAVVTAQTAVTPVSATSTASATMTAALTMKTCAKVSWTLLIHHLVLCQLSSVSVSPPQLVPRLVKAGVVRATTLRTSATATPSAPSTTTAAATMQTSVTVRVAAHPVIHGIVPFPQVSVYQSNSNADSTCLEWASHWRMKRRYVATLMLLRCCNTKRCQCC